MKITDGMRRSILRIAPLLIMIMLSGCGGGGSSSVTPNATVTITGTVKNSDGTSAAGDSVRFDNLAAVSSAVNSSGNYTLSVPVTSIQGNDKLWIYDPQGKVIDVATIVGSANQSGTTTINVIVQNVAPGQPGI